ncbi:MAG TPA: hypothetical protein VFA07_07245 [Chthonomonadaceae bacterium]|nr:hypothetical protein [Chthonomonadaceae bacterium]
MPVEIPRFRIGSQKRDRLAIAAIVILGALLSAIYLPHSYDDAYITYRYAYNLATGHGYVYNPGERFLGTSAPLYGLLLGVLGAPWPARIPLISGALSGLALILTGVALYLLGKRLGSPFCGLLAAIFYSIHPITLTAFGGEILFEVMLVAWAFVFYLDSRTMAAAVLLAAAVLIRPDSLLAALVLGGHTLLRRRRVPWREAIVLLAILLPFLLLARIYYGAFLPHTLSAKAAQTRFGWPTFLGGVLVWMRNPWRDTPLEECLRWLTFLGILFLWRFRGWLLVLAWPALFCIAYKFLRIPFYKWYLVPPVFASAILQAMAVAGCVELLLIGVRRLRRAPLSVRTALMGKALALLALTPVIAAQILYGQSGGNNGRNAIVAQYLQTARWLQAHTDANASVGYLEIGYIGYYSQRRMIDPLGLVNSGVAAHVAQGDLGWAYERYRPDYILVHPRFNAILGSVYRAPWFQQEYRSIAQIQSPGSASILVFRRVLPVKG